MSARKRIGAFFDLDGTLLAPPSLESRFARYLLARSEITGMNLIRWLAHCAKRVFRDGAEAVAENKLYLAGLRESLAGDWACSQAAQNLPFFTEALERMSWHHDLQHQILLLTGTLAPLARAIAPQLPCPIEICATELESLGGRWTGLLAGSHMSGEAKSRALRCLAAQRRIDLAASFAYGNCMADFAMLSAVGRPVAVNPSPRLALHARTRGWAIARWRQPHAARHIECENVPAIEETR